MSQQPSLGTINHLALNVSNYDKSYEFYDSFLPKLGYKLHIKNVHYTSWLNPHSGQFCIAPIKEETKDDKHKRYSVGFHHLAWNARYRKEVDEFHEFLVEKNYKILDAPQEYNYVPGYYAVFWEDLDGMKLELCHVPIPECALQEHGTTKDENSTKRQKIE